eukprot:s436_g2.t1
MTSLKCVCCFDHSKVQSCDGGMWCGWTWMDTSNDGIECTIARRVTLFFQLLFDVDSAVAWSESRTMLCGFKLHAQAVSLF